MNIYISNLDSSVNDENLKSLFSGYGEVKSAEIMHDLFTGEPRGFGFVEMEDDESALKAIHALNNSELQSLTISVKQAPPKQRHKGSYKVGNGAINVYRFKKN